MDIHSSTWLYTAMHSYTQAYGLTLILNSVVIQYSTGLPVQVFLKEHVFKFEIFKNANTIRFPLTADFQV